MSEPDATQTDDAVDPGEPIPAPATAEVPGTRRRARARRGRFIPVDDDHDGRVDTIGVDRTGDGIIDERDDPEAPVYEMTYRGNRVKVAVLDVEQPPPPPRPSMDDVLADIRAGYESQIAGLKSFWRKLWAVIGGLGSASAIAYVFMALYYGSLWWGAGYTPVQSHSEAFVQQAIDTPGSWIDGLHPEEQAAAVRAVEADKRERGDD